MCSMGLLWKALHISIFLIVYTLKVPFGIRSSPYETLGLSINVLSKGFFA